MKRWQYDGGLRESALCEELKDSYKGPAMGSWSGKSDTKIKNNPTSL